MKQCQIRQTFEELPGNQATKLNFGMQPFLGRFGRCRRCEASLCEASGGSISLFIFLKPN
jgi:hypothetical protein